MVGSILVLAQKLLVQVIAVRFHRTAFLDRIKAVHFASDVITKLNVESRKLLKRKANILQILEQRRNRMQRAFRLSDAAAIKKAAFWKKRGSLSPSPAGDENNMSVRALLDPSLEVCLVV
jgi:hypothetical protein